MHISYMIYIYKYIIYIDIIYLHSALTYQYLNPESLEAWYPLVKLSRGIRFFLVGMGPFSRQLLHVNRAVLAGLGFLFACMGNIRSEHIDDYSLEVGEWEKSLGKLAVSVGR